MELLKLTEENEKLQNYALRMKADMENIFKFFVIKNFVCAFHIHSAFFFALIVLQHFQNFLKQCPILAY